MANQDGGRGNDERPEDERPNLALRIGIASAVGIGALATGLVFTRQGRKLVRDVFGGQRRTPLESRVLDTLWQDRVLGRRTLDVDESEAGVVMLFGRVRSDEERERALDLVEEVKGVAAVMDRMTVDPRVGKLRLGA